MAVDAGDAVRTRSGRARLPTQGRGEALLLLGPCALYLVAFSIFPLVTSLVRSFQDYDTRADTWTWIGLSNYSQLIHSSEFWTVVENTVLLTGAGVAIQVVLGTALALFFNQQLRGSWIVRGILILPMLLTPIVVGLMWRALLNPDWGLLNWVAVELGFGYVGWLSDPHVAIWTLILVDSWQWTPFVFVIVYARLQALPQEVFEAGSVDGANWFQRTAYLTLAAAGAGDRLRSGLPGDRRLPDVRPRLRPDERRPGELDHDALLPGVPERLRVPALRLRVGDLVRDGARRRDRGHAALPGREGAPRGGLGVTAHRFGRVALLHRADRDRPGRSRCRSSTCCSCRRKSRLDILEVPPTLDFDWATIKANYAEVIHEDGYFTFVKNSVIVTGVSTLIALVLGVPAGYAFSRLRFRGSDTWASTILSFRFMPPVAVAIPIYLMIRYVGLLDGYLGLILPYVAFSLPLVVWIMIGFFDEIPREIDEAAMVDGLTRPFVLLKVLLPLARPGMLVAATFGVIFIWNEFLVGLYVINSQDH